MPTVLLATDVFGTLGQLEARALGLAGMPILTVAHPLSDSSMDAVRCKALELVDQVARVLTTSAAEVAEEFTHKRHGRSS